MKLEFKPGLSRIFWLAGMVFLLVTWPRVPSRAGEEKAPLAGTWKLVLVEGNGLANELGKKTPSWVIKGNRVFYGGEELARLNIDTAANPKIVDVTFTGSKKTYEGIYRLDKDRLKICLNRQSAGVKERPNGFATEGKENWRLLAFERAKGAGADPMAGLNGFIGLALAYDKKNRIIVNAVLEGSPAKKAGLQKDDILLKVPGGDVTNLRSTVEAVQQVRPGSEITVRVRRGEKEMDIKIRVGVLPFHFLTGLE